LDRNRFHINLKERQRLSWIDVQSKFHGVFLRIPEIDNAMFAMLAP
jgi:hypothetical protein